MEVHIKVLVEHQVNSLQVVDFELCISILTIYHGVSYSLHQKKIYTLVSKPSRKLENVFSEK